MNAALRRVRRMAGVSALALALALGLVLTAPGWAGADSRYQINAIDGIASVSVTERSAALPGDSR